MNILEYETLLASIITLSSTLLGFWIKNKIGNSQESPQKRAQRQMELLTSKNEEIYVFLNAFKQKLSADRVYIFEFSNGNYFSSGLPISKFTCTYESVSEGITTECHNPGEYRVSNFNEYIKEMIEGKPYVLEDISLCQKVLLKELLIKKGVKSIYNFPIKDIHDHVIGFFGVDYVKQYHKLPQEEIKECYEAAQKLSGYLKIEK